MSCFGTEKGAAMYPDQIEDDYIRDIQEGLARILEEIMKGENNHE